MPTMIRGDDIAASVAGRSDPRHVGRGGLRGAAPAARRTLSANLTETLARIARIAGSQVLSEVDRAEIARRHRSLRNRLMRAVAHTNSAPGLQRLGDTKRRTYEEVFSLIYDCASDIRGAKALVDRVLSRLEE